jgi:hypothetical protein
MTNSSVTTSVQVTTTTYQPFMNPIADNFYVRIVNVGPETFWFGADTGNARPLAFGDASENFYVIGTTNGGSGVVSGNVSGGTAEIYYTVTTL